MDEKAPRVPVVSPKPTWTRPELIEAMGLSYDPFVTAFSEGDPTGSFADIFIDPKPSLLERLQRPAPMLVLADYGMGKTATRLAFEYWLRTATFRPARLCVSYTPRVQDAARLDGRELLEHHRWGLAAAAAIDMIVQLIERVDEAPFALTDVQREALARQVQALPPRFQQRFRHAAEQPPASGALWGGALPLAGIRPTVRYVAVTPRWRELVALIAASTGSQRIPQPWPQVLADARTLGFESLFLLVDAIDEGGPDPAAQRRLVEPLLAVAHAFAEQKCYLKCFVPPAYLEVGSPIRTSVHALTENIEIARIDRATPQDLIAMIHERLQAASTSPASFQSLDLLARGDISESIEERLARLADGSPRRMMLLVSRFLDFCAELDARHGDRRERPFILREEWERFLSRVEAGPGSGGP